MSNSDKQIIQIMINQDNFIESDPPSLHCIFTAKHPADDIALEFWEHLVEFLQIQIVTDPKSNQQSKELKESKGKGRISRDLVQLLFAKGKEGMLTIWKFQNSCLMFQKSIQIQHYLSKQITVIKAFSFHLPRSKSILKGDTSAQKQLNILALGYIDGTVQLFEITLQQSTVQLTKCLQIKNSNEQPVSNIAVYDKTDLYVCRCHLVYLYPKLVEDLHRKLSTQSREQLNSTETLLKLKELNSSTRLSLFVSENNLHIYNQLEGMFSFSLPQMQSSGSIIDAIKTMCETSQGDLIIASADDSVKILYAESNEIERIVGLKSFVSSIALNEIPQEKIIELWMADLYGELHYMLKKRKTIISRKNSSFLEDIMSESKHHPEGKYNEKEKEKHSLIQSTREKDKHKDKEKEKQGQLYMFQEEFKRSVKVNENGIKQIIVTKNMLVIVDTQMNILVYDVVRNFQSQTGRSSK